MARPKSENAVQVAFKIPQSWVDIADEVAEAMSQPGIDNTRTDAMRAALYRGLVEMKEQYVPKKLGDFKPSTSLGDIAARIEKASHGSVVPKKKR